MRLVDVKRTKAEKKQEQAKYEEPTVTDDYPWGLSIRLDNDTINKLGLGDLDANQEVRLFADGFVSEDSATKRNGTTDRSVSIQITKLAVLPAESKEDIADDLYGKQG
jgi:hypothetical protein